MCSALHLVALIGERILLCSFFDPCFGRFPWRRAWQPTPVLLHGESHGQRSLAGYSLLDCKECDSTEMTEHRGKIKEAPRGQKVLQLSQIISVVYYHWVDHFTNLDKKMRQLGMHKSLIFKVPLELLCWHHLWVVWHCMCEGWVL